MTRNALEAFALADLAFAQSELTEREIHGKPLSPGDKTRIGLLKHDLEAQIGKKIDADGYVVDPDGEPVKYTGKVSISESNRRWFAEHGTHGTGGTDG